ncbi:MAG: flagellar protein FlaG [Lachnospiraceae bacterium]|nr:flagellar protein FlaG [Lachnospiraceae bacterium]MBP3506710.1 flagellar protein FlaG [Lachnospiraceae bacterium]
MGIGGIESSVASSSVRSLNTKTTAPEVTSVQSVTAVAENYAKVAKPTEGSNANNNNENQNPQEQMYNDGVPIQEVSKEKVESALRDINTKIRPTHTECQFSYHEETKRISIKVLDQESGEVIREIPPEKTLDMIAKTLELAGILVDEKR